jgi:hypothetical protein
MRKYYRASFSTLDQAGPECACGTTDQCRRLKRRLSDKNEDGYHDKGQQWDRINTYIRIKAELTALPK